MIIEVHVKPNSSQTEIIEESEKFMKVALSSKPEDGEANRELVKFLSKHFGNGVRILRGLKSKKKIIEIIN